MRLTFPAVVATVLAGFVASCSSSPPDAPPILNSPPTRTPSGGTDAGIPDGGAGGKSDAGNAGQDASLRKTHWHGTLDTLPPQSFGNTSGCVYQVTLSNIVVDLVLDDAGTALEGTVQNRMVEENVSCTSTTLIPPNNHLYTVVPGGDAFKVVSLKADSKNNPQADVLLAVGKDGNNLVTTIQWHRTDAVEIYNWTVTGHPTLSPVTP